MQPRIGLYGGSFDPVHTGHSSIARSFLKSGFINELWILLTPSPPHKHNSNLTSYKHRLNMLQLAFEGNEHIHIKTIENELPKPSYTYRTIQFLVESFPKSRFYFCLGGDSLSNFDTWKHPEIILEHVELLVAKRPDTNYDTVNNSVLKRSHFIHHNPIDVSSTQIKSSLVGNKSIQGLVDQKVERYIRTHQLYVST